ncbi:MAG: sugar transferase [Chloroflexota bacterium]
MGRGPKLKPPGPHGFVPELAGKRARHPGKVPGLRAPAGKVIINQPVLGGCAPNERWPVPQPMAKDYPVRPAGRLQFRPVESERRLLLLGVDLGAVGLGAAAGFLLWNLRAGDPTPLPATLAQNLEWLGALEAGWVVMALALGLYDLRVAAHPRLFLPRLGLALGIELGVYLAVYFLAPPLTLPRFFYLAFLGTQAGLVGAWRLAYARWVTGPGFRRRLLIVGAGWAGATLAEALAREEQGLYEPLGFLDDDPEKQGRVVTGLKVLGPARDLPRLVRELGVDEVAVAVTNGLSPELYRALIECWGLGVHLEPMPIIYERLTGRVPVQHIGPNWALAAPVGSPPGHMWLAAKRLLDLAFALAGGTVLLLVLPVVALAVWLEDRGPVFYRQVRCGRGGRPFKMLKFRSMVVDAEAGGQPVWAAEADPRVTRVGRVLRRTRLDELPQVINVLKGEMSIVGPRPERPELVAELERQIPFYRARLAVRPGVTGWAQVNYGYGRSVEDALIKLQYDLYYIKHQSLWLNLQVIWRTLARLIL